MLRKNEKQWNQGKKGKNVTATKFRKGTHWKGINRLAAWLLVFVSVFELAVPSDFLLSNYKKAYAETITDTQAPTAPANLDISGSADAIILSWDASSDDVGVTGYKIYRNDVEIGTSTETSYTDDTITEAGSYTYTVKAYDASGNLSEASNALILTITSGDGSDPSENTEIPTAPTNLSMSGSADAIIISWDASSDDVGVEGYKIYRDGAEIGTTTDTSYTDDTLTDTGSYVYTVKAYDADGNLSQASAALTVTITSGDGSDPSENNEIPTAPTNLSISGTSLSVILSWDASSDDVGVEGYKIYRDGVEIGTSTGTSYTDDSITKAGTYLYTVKAYDAEGNLSEASGGFYLTIGDNQAPSIPQNVTAAIGEGPVIILSWDACFDYFKVEGYKIYRNDEEIGTTTETTFTDNSVIIGDTYHYTVKAYDAEGNLSDASDIVSAIYDNTVDTDSDGLFDYIEYNIGTKINKIDTDGDGLSDYYEYNTLGTDPTVVDTDGDGISDADEDSDEDGLPNDYEFYVLYPLLLNSSYNEEDGINPLDDYDQDGLTNIDEYLAQTNPGVADSDGDGLGDFSEVREYQTNATLYDTDGDGLGDGTEIINGLDPLIADTDQNGISDGNEVFTQSLIDAEYADISALNLDVEPRLYITGSGDYSDQIDVSVENNNKTFDNLDYIVSEIFEIKHNDDLTFENAKIELELSDEVLNSSDISDLKVIRLDYETGSVDILTTQYDAGKKMIYSEVDELCYYAVADIGALTNDTDMDNASSVFKTGKADLVFVIDTTGSMGRTIDNVKNNIETYVNDLHEKNIDVRLGLVEFKDIYEDSVNSTKSYGFYEDVDSFINDVDSLVPDGGGDLDETAVDALYEARKMEYRAGSNKFIILVTDAEYKDGIQSDSSYTMEDETDALAKEGFNVSVISRSGYQTTYQNLYTNTNGIFANISGDFADVLNPLVEVMDAEVNDSTWIRLSDLSLVNVDMDLDEDDTDLNEEYEKDSDEDGIPDIIEMGKEVTVNIPIKFDSLGVPTEYKSIQAWSYKSNPYLKDTDGDGFLDSEDPYPKEFNMTVKELRGDNVIELNTGSLYCIFGMDINEFYEMYYTRNLRPLEKGTLEALKRQLEINTDMNFTADEGAFLCNIDIDGIKDYMQYENNYFQDRVYEKLTGASAETEMAVAFFKIISSKEAWKKYVSDAVDQILFGKYTEAGNLLGTAGELGVAFTGVDFVQDIRDLSHDILFWETSWEHVGETTIDGIGLIPIIGMFAKSDEIFTVCKRSDDLYEIRKVKNLEKIINTAGGLKYISKTAEIVNTAKDVMKSYSTYLYWKVLDTLEGVNGYKLAFAGSGIYDNRLINAITNNVDDLKYIEEVNPAKATEALQEITSNSIGKSADEIDEIVDSSLTLTKKTLQEWLNDVLNEYTEKIISKIKVVGTYSEGKTASEILREEMISAGIDINSVAPYPNAAHHIVPAAETYPSAINAQNLLERYGFDLNSAANGVLLPYKQWETVTSEAIHSGRHTKEYCDYVWDKLSEVDISTADDIAVILNEIRESLLKGELEL